MGTTTHTTTPVDNTSTTTSDTTSSVLHAITHDDTTHQTTGTSTSSKHHGKTVHNIAPPTHSMEFNDSNTITNVRPMFSKSFGSSNDNSMNMKSMKLSGANSVLNIGLLLI